MTMSKAERCFFHIPKRHPAQVHRGGYTLVGLIEPFSWAAVYYFGHTGVSLRVLHTCHSRQHMFNVAYGGWYLPCTWSSQEKLSSFFHLATNTIASGENLCNKLPFCRLLASIICWVTLNNYKIDIQWQHYWILDAGVARQLPIWFCHLFLPAAHESQQGRFSDVGKPPMRVPDTLSSPCWCFNCVVTRGSQPHSVHTHSFYLFYFCIRHSGVDDVGLVGFVNPWAVLWSFFM